jgi:hypothetical protein
MKIKTKQPITEMNKIPPANFSAAARLARRFAAQEEDNRCQTQKKETTRLKFKTLDEVLSDFLGYATATTEGETDYE